MNAQEYRKACLRTWPTINHGTRKERISNAYLGIIEECLEVMNSNDDPLEIGDVLFYLEVFCFETKTFIAPESSCFFGAEPHFASDMMLMRHGMSLAGFVKKTVYHDKDLCLHKILSQIYANVIGRKGDLSLSDLREMNIAKLKKRYPNGTRCEDCTAPIPKQYESPKCISCDGKKVNTHTKGE